MLLQNVTNITKIYKQTARTGDLNFIIFPLNTER